MFIRKGVFMMMTTIKYEILKVIRNKRFIMFTLVAPLFFYILLYNMSSVKTGAMSMMLAVLCSTFATTGSGINTLSSRIAREKPYINNVLITTPYSPGKFVVITSAVQLLLNILIEAVIVAFGVALFHLTLTKDLLVMEGIILYLSSFYVLVGLCLGFVLELVALQAIAFPIYFLVMVTNITQQMYPNMPKALVIAQKAFPGFYATNLITSISNNTKDLKSLLILTLYILGMLAITLLIYRRKQTAVAGT